MGYYSNNNYDTDLHVKLKKFYLWKLLMSRGGIGRQKGLSTPGVH